MPGLFVGKQARVLGGIALAAWTGGTRPPADLAVPGHPALIDKVTPGVPAYRSRPYRRGRRYGRGRMG